MLFCWLIFFVRELMLEMVVYAERVPKVSKGPTTVKFVAWIGFWTKYEILRMRIKKYPFQNSFWSRLIKIVRNSVGCRKSYLYEFETKSLLKIIFITIVTWYNCFLLQNGFSSLVHSLWQQKRCKGFNIKDSKCWILERIVSIIRQRFKIYFISEF